MSHLSHYQDNIVNYVHLYVIKLMLKLKLNLLRKIRKDLFIHLYREKLDLLVKYVVTRGSVQKSNAKPETEVEVNVG